MVSPLPIICNEPTAPSPMECQTTEIYGVPRRTPGRGASSIQGIAIHGIADNYEAYLAKACVGYTKLPVGCHASMHYVIDGETGRVTSLVREEDIAWAFQSYRGNFPVTTPVDACPCPPPCPAPPCPEPPAPETYPGWPILAAANPNLSADFYTINIGVVTPAHPEQLYLDGVDCCPGPWGMSPQAYNNLVRLVRWIEERYVSIPLDEQHIQFHDYIVQNSEDCLEIPCGPQGACFICDVSNYCERCMNRSNPSVSTTVTDIRYVYGENSSGCQVKILLADFIALLNQE